MKHVDRRTFLKSTTILAAGTILAPVTLRAADTQSSIVVVHGTNVKKMLETGVAQLGGWSAFVKKGQKVTIKPNAAWASKPETGANTDPDLVGACVASCLKAGGSEVVLPENTCSPHLQSFKMSGIQKAVKKAGGKLYRPVKDKQFRSVKIGGQVLKEAKVPIDVVDTGCLINMPVAKSHGGATLTISMKNWMGSVKDRGFWHRKGLHDCIAEFSTRIKPDLIVVDATRIMVTKGPRGPGKVEYPKQIIVGTDPVAIDAYAATLFEKAPFDIPYIKLAHQMKVGCGDLSKVEVNHIDA